MSVIIFFSTGAKGQSPVHPSGKWTASKILFLRASSPEDLTPEISENP